MAELDAILKKYTDPSTSNLHGATFVAVDGKGNDLYRASFGSRTVDRSEPLTPDTLTWIASQTKLVTSVAAMQLVEKGLIGLDDDVREILPQLKDVQVLLGFEGDEAATDATSNAGFDNIAKGNVNAESAKPTGKPIFEPVKGKITLRHLMSHSSGLCYDLGNPLLMKFSAATGRTDNMFSGKIEGSTHPLVYQPGESWEYGVGLDWVGRVIETLTKQDLDTYMRTNIWGQLSAPSFSFHPTKHFSPKPMPPLHETAYRQDSQGLAPGPPVWPLEPRDAIGGAGLYGTATEYIKLLGALVSGGGSLLRPESVDELFSRQFGAASGSGEAFRAFARTTGMVNLFRPTVDGDDKDDKDIMDHSLVGALALKDVRGRRKAGTVSWAGLPNLVWWVDRKGGVAATLFTQVMPSGDAKCGALAWELEEALYRLVDGKQ